MARTFLVVAVDIYLLVTLSVLSSSQVSHFFTLPNVNGPMFAFSITFHDLNQNVFLENEFVKPHDLPGFP